MGGLAAVGALGMAAVVGADFYHRTMDLGQALRKSAGRALSALAFIIIGQSLLHV